MVNDIVTALSIALLLLVHNRHDVWLIYLVAGIYGVSGQIYRAARGGLLHSMVPEAQLGEANGLFSSLSQGLKIVGPFASAGIYAAWGGGVVALADIGTFVFSISSYLALRPVAEPTGRPVRRYVRPGPRRRRYVRPGPRRGGVRPGPRRRRCVGPGPRCWQGSGMCWRIR